MFEPVEERAAKQALELAAGLALPVTARSRPSGEVRSNGCALGVIVLVLGLVASLLFAALLAGASAVPEPRRTIILVAILGFAAFVLLSLVKGWRSRRADYVDPQLVVEAGREGVTLRRPGASHMLRYAEVRMRVSSIAVRHSVRFVGVKMESPFGTISLDDALFTGGREAAAAIVRGMRDARERRG
jgi:4-amino-4-deoxy-L-arabinose transferase-like glycosyltransferase